MLDRVQEQLTRRWERNQALVTHTRDRLAQYEAGLMDLREALNRAVGTTREAEELNSRNQERLEEALVESWPRPSSSLPPWTLHPVTPTCSQTLRGEQRHTNSLFNREAHLGLQTAQ